MNAPANFLDTAARLSDRALARSGTVREADRARADLERIETGLLARSRRLLDLQRAGAETAAEALQREIRVVVGGEWLGAQRRLARALDRLGQLPDADRFLLDDADEAVEINGYHRVAGGWIETEARARHCVTHADKPLAAGDKLFCTECRAAANVADGPDTRAIRLPSETLIVDPVERPDRPCPSCHSDAWRERSAERGGGWLCGACHPPIDRGDEPR